MFGRKSNRASKATLFIMAVVLSLGIAGSAQAMKATSLGFKPGEAGGGGWIGGNLGKTWAEGEWVPYQLILADVASGLAELDSIVISFDFNASGYRFIDLVRGLQVGTTPLTDAQAWPQPDGSAFPMTTRAQIEIAQNHPGEGVWTGFSLLNLPDAQVNRTPSGGLDVPPGGSKHIFKIYKSDLLAAGININQDTVVVYYQFHEARTFIWQNRLQATYDAPPSDGWGGYLYGTDSWDTLSVLGSGYVPGASGHMRLEAPGSGQEIPIPIPLVAPGMVSGLKWRDDNGNGVQDASEPGLSGWEVHVSGTVEGITLSSSTQTDGSGNYTFPGLTVGTWTIKEDEQRDDPAEGGYSQTYPTMGAQVGQGTAVAVGSPPPDAAPVGWEVVLTSEVPDQADMNFGNQRCNLSCDVIFDDDSVCTGFDASFTASATDGTPPYTYDWSGPAGFTASTATIDIIDAQTSNAGNYRVIVTDAFGCADTCDQDLTVHSKPSLQVTPDGDAVCAGFDASFTASVSGGTSPFTYSWSGPGGFSATTATIDISDAQQADEGTYEVIVTDAHDCADTASVELTVYTLDLTAPQDDSVHAADDFLSTDFSISAGKGITVGICGMTPSPSHQPDVVASHVEWETECADDGKTFTICLEAVDDFGCKDTAYFNVAVYNTPPQLTCPDDGVVNALETFVSSPFSVFEPDGDPAPVTFLKITGPDSPANLPQVVGNHVEWATTLAERGKTYAIWLVAIDHCGLADTCSFLVRVDQPTGEFECPEDDSVHAGAYFISTDFTLTYPECDPSTVEILDVSPSPTNDPIIVGYHVEWQTTCNLGDYVITLITNEQCSVPDTCSFTVTVYNLPPELICPDYGQVHPQGYFISTDFQVSDPYGEEVLVSLLGTEPHPDGAQPFIKDRHVEWQTECVEGDYVITLVATDPCGLADTCEFWVSVYTDFPPDFTIWVNPTTQFVKAGLSVGYLVEINNLDPSHQFTWPCSLSVTGQPVPPNSANFDDPVMTPVDFSTLNVHTVPATDTGTYTLIVMGRAVRGTVVHTHSKQVKLVVAIPSDVNDEDDTPSTPSGFALFQNQPNPFNPSTHISYYLPKACDVKLTVYNVLGRKVRVLFDGYQSAGAHFLRWDGTDDSGAELGSGIYIYRLQTNGFADSKKMILMK
jgi:hypothetical protein